MYCLKGSDMLHSAADMRRHPALKKGKEDLLILIQKNKVLLGKRL
jgi:hypothetical protein